MPQACHAAPAQAAMLEPVNIDLGRRILHKQDQTCMMPLPCRAAARSAWCSC